MGSKNLIIPNTFLVGAQKAGTTSLYDWLSQHPQIYAPLDAKDIHFFSHPNFKNKALENLAEYYNQSNNEAIILQGAVNYLFFQETAEKIYKYAPDAKIIISLRHPVQRAISAYHYFTELGAETRSFEKAIADELAGKNKTHEALANFTYLQHSLYFEQVKLFIDTFGKKQVHIIIFEELMQQKEEQIQKVSSFLDVDTNFIPKWKHQNKSGNARYPVLNRLLVANSNFKQNLKQLIPYHKFVPLKWRIKFVDWLRKTNKKAIDTNIEKPQLPDQQIQLLKTDVEYLSELLGRNLFTLWNFKD